MMSHVNFTMIPSTELTGKNTIMHKDVFIQEVQAELVQLRNTITPEQIQKLKPEEFEHYSSMDCVYGLLEINWQDRNQQYKYITHNGMSGETFVPFQEHDFTEGENRTALEKYLYMIERNNQLEILKYIKGEINEIDLNII